MPVLKMPFLLDDEKLFINESKIENVVSGDLL